jgi:predicted P-loop ATPase
MAAHILRRDPNCKGKLWFDSYKRKTYLSGRDLEELDAARLVEYASRAYDECIGVDAARDALGMVAAENERDPLRDYLTGLVWDGQKRLRELLPRGFGAAVAPAPARAAGPDPYDGWTAEQIDGELTREMGRRWMIQAAWRALQPGCKADVALVVFGGQGVKKSTGFKALTGPEWFSDQALPIGQKDADVSTLLRKAWVHELAELTDVRRVEVNKLKAFVTRTVEHYRPAYGHFMVEEPRRCVFVGTTNDKQFLKDPTGERRWWPAEGGRVDMEWILANRDQLWAEAVYVARKGMEEGADAPRLRYWFEDQDPADKSLIAALAERHGDFTEEDPWTPIIAAWLAKKPVHSVNGVTTGDVLSGALTMPASQLERHHESRAGACLKRLGWEKKREMRNGFRDWYYYPRGDS